MPKFQVEEIVTVVVHKNNTFSMPLQDVTDEVGHGNLHVTESVLQQNDEQVVTQKQTIVDEISDDGQEIIIVPETEITRVVNDDEFDEEVQNDLKVVKQLWANMAEHEKPFTPFVLRSRKKKDKQKVRSRPAI
ncbi:hypothetical protein A2U01_0005560 [Trifolium medium]|uniref:Uncharacterized protein n=1 Tax=Trifolium medium TaxID=97028 RepID=A0A392MC94_9FABA|nr:hypothetical protein [Trifolium medium]